MIRTGNEELFREGDVLEVSCPKQERVLCRRTTQVIVTRRLDNNAKVMGLGKFYSSLERCKHLPLWSGSEINRT
jgi:hypothetical protein